MKRFTALLAVLMFTLVATLLVAIPAIADTKPQPRDPRISQQEALALINMDPVDMSYRTNYDTHVTGVLLVPSPGPIQGKKGWYANLAVPAGVYMDIPKGSIFEPFTFTAPNGDTVEAVKVTLPFGTQATVNACGNGHKPNRPMIMKMIEPLTETVTETVPDFSGALAKLNEAIDRIGQDVAKDEPEKPTVIVVKQKEHGPLYGFISFILTGLVTCAATDCTKKTETVTTLPPGQ